MAIACDLFSNCPSKKIVIKTIKLRAACAVSKDSKLFDVTLGHDYHLFLLANFLMKINEGKFIHHPLGTARRSKISSKFRSSSLFRRSLEVQSGKYRASETSGQEESYWDCVLQPEASVGLHLREAGTPLNTN